MLGCKKCTCTLFTCSYPIIRTSSNYEEEVDEDVFVLQKVDNAQYILYILFSLFIMSFSSLSCRVVMVEDSSTPPDEQIESRPSSVSSFTPRDEEEQSRSTSVPI